MYRSRINCKNPPLNLNQMIKLYAISKKKIFLISILIILVDQLSKHFSYSYLNSGKLYTLIPKVIGFRLVKNYGAAFSILSNSSNLLAFISLLTSLLLIIYIIQINKFSPIKGLALSFILGGCIGNGIDRWLFGYVYDFIELIIINFPIFNIADISFNIGVILLILNSLGKSQPNH